MMLVSISDAGKPSNNERVFRTSHAGDLVATIIFLLLLLSTCGVYLYQVIKGLAGFWWFVAFVWFGFWFGFIAWLAWKRYKDARLPSNWLMKANWEGVLIKFRSFQNHHYPESDLAVIYLSWNDMDWVRKSKEASRKEDADGVLTEFWTYLDIHLRLPATDLAIIENGLTKERKERLLNTTKYEDYPVRLIDNDILRIRWNRIKPGIASTLEALVKNLRIESELNFTTDTTVSHASALSDEELDEMIRERIEKGDSFDASVLLQKHRGYTSTQATQYIDKFTATPARR